VLEDAETGETLRVHDGGFEGHVLVDGADDDYTFVCFQFCEVFEYFYMGELSGSLGYNSLFCVDQAVVVRMRILQ